MIPELRTDAECMAAATEIARANFAVNPSTDGLMIYNDLFMLVEDGCCNGTMDLEMAARFGAAC
jgi:hypothetical protein